MALDDPGPLTVAVLAGGRSSEREVSLASGAAVRDGLRAGGHEVVWVEIEQDGTWTSDGARISVTPGAGLLGSDVVFPTLHGPFGEDGTIQGMFETLDVPYVGAGVTASAVCMDKVLFKQLMAAAGTMRQVDYRDVHERRFRADATAVLDELAQLGLPVFVKPAHLGSSLGIVKVSSLDAVDEALQEALTYDDRVIVEAMAPGIEVECGVLGPDFASEPGEISYRSDWYDYEAKYSPGGMELMVPARISDSARERVRGIALQAFTLTGCEGLARADFFVDGEHVILNELNTMPGFTPTSVYAKLLAASGVAYEALLSRLCRLALERHARLRAYSH